VASPLDVPTGLRVTWVLNGAVVLAYATDMTLLSSPFGSEEMLVEGASQRRRRHFLTGRACARAALATLGTPPTEIPSAGRRPVWPASVNGSITHTEGFVGAAVARADECAGVGLDAESEPIERADVRDRVLTAAERAVVDGLAPEHRPWAATRHFSAKEAFYKALPGDLMGRADFWDVGVSIGASTLRYTLAPGGALAQDPRIPRNGVWTELAGCVITLVLRDAVID